MRKPDNEVIEPTSGALTAKTAVIRVVMCDPVCSSSEALICQKAALRNPREVKNRMSTPSRSTSPNGKSSARVFPGMLV